MDATNDLRSDANVNPLPNTQLYLMHIPSYQIRNFLNTYRKHLCKGANEKQRKEFANLDSQNSKKAARGRRQAIIKIVGGDIFNKINQFCTRLNADGKTDLQKQMISVRSAGLKHGPNKQFVFNVIDENNEKSCQSLSIKDKNFFLKSTIGGKDR